MNSLNNKRVLIAPYTKTSDAFKRKLLELYPQVKILGFIDKVQNDDGIFKIEEINFEIDYILILSPNHFNAIYSEYKQLVPSKKLMKISIVNNQYVFLSNNQIMLENLKNCYPLFREKVFYYGAKLLDKVGFKREKFVFISKDFVGGNNKFLFLYMQDNNENSVLLTNNRPQYEELKRLGYTVELLTSVKASFSLCFAKNIIVDQGDNSALLNLSSSKQRTIQIWHGVPLEHMNLLTDIEYDYFISTSDYVSETSFQKVFLSKEFVPLGYPRNDVFLKHEHNKSDLLFTDSNAYSLVKEKYGTQEKVVVYMPTFRESDFGEQSTQFNSMPLDFEELNEQLLQINTYMIIKLHPFVMVFYKDMIQNLNYSNVIFHNIQGDIYPILKYTDILITDYSSVYADFLLLNRPIIFFLYDHGTCSKMAHGYLYEFDEVSPGERAFNQSELINVISKINNNQDEYEEERLTLQKKFFKYCDANASKRIGELLK